MLQAQNAAPRDVLPERIGILNDLFYSPELYRETGRGVNCFSA